MDADPKCPIQEGRSSAFHAASCSVLPVPFYRDEYVTIYHGDCREIMPMLERFDLLLTDPPYGMNALDGSRTTRRYGMARKGNWDDEKIDGEAIAAAMEKATLQIIWGMNYLCNLLPPHKKFLMWQKPHVEHLETRSSAEIAFTNIPGPAKHHRCRSGSNPQHPTQKPLGLMQWCNGASSKRGTWKPSSTRGREVAPLDTPQRISGNAPCSSSGRNAIAQSPPLVSRRTCSHFIHRTAISTNSDSHKSLHNKQNT